MPFIEFTITTTRLGLEHYRLKCAELPKHMLWKFVVFANGSAEATSQANGKHSRRYHWFKNTDAALTAGRKWAERKVREAKKATF